MIAKIENINHEIYADKSVLSIELPLSERSNVLEWLEKLSIESGKEYDITIKKHRHKRTLDANSYYWVLIKKIASVLGASMNEIHNQELAKYGTLLTDSDGKVLYCLYKASIDYLNNEHVHLKPTGQTEERKNVTYEWFMVLKPSHEMDSKEFSDLIDGVISDAKEIGIDTDIPHERTK